MDPHPRTTQTPNLGNPPVMVLEGKYARLAQVLRELQLSQAALASATNIDATVLSKAVNGAGSLERHWATLGEYLLEHHQISLEWLLLGKGSMRIGTTSGVHPAVRMLSSTGGATLAEVGLITQDGIFRASQAGRRHDLLAYGVVQVMDEAMSPMLRHGQWAMVANTDIRPPRDGDVVVFQTNDGMAYVRRMRTVVLPGDGDGYLLEPLNREKSYRTLLVSDEERRKVCVVVGVIFE